MRRMHVYYAVLVLIVSVSLALLYVKQGPETGESHPEDQDRGGVRFTQADEASTSTRHRVDERLSEASTETSGPEAARFEDDGDSELAELANLSERYGDLPDSGDEDIADERFELLAAIARLQIDPRIAQEAILDLIASNSPYSFARDDGMPAAAEALSILWNTNHELLLDARDRLSTEENPRILEALALACIHSRERDELAGLDRDLAWLADAHDDSMLRGLIALNAGLVRSESGAGIELLRSSLHDASVRRSAIFGCRSTLHNYTARPVESRQISEAEHDSLVDDLIAVAASDDPTLTRADFHLIVSVLNRVAADRTSEIPRVAFERFYSGDR